jgi:phytoene dehydrogenase-like protein
MSTDYDVLVIGAGAGGLFAAARLAKAGRRVLVVERLDKVGGRASTTEVDGFKVNDGAIVIEVGGITEETCREVGAVFDIREPSPPILYRVGKKDVDVTGGGWGLLLSKMSRSGAKILGGIGAARSDDGLPEHEQTLEQWLNRYTKNESVHGIFRNMCASIFAVGSDELPARVFLTYFTRKSAFKRFGFHPEGTIGLWRALADVVTANGSEVRLSTEVTSLEMEPDSATAVLGDGTAVTAKVVLSNVGPSGTVRLVGEEHFDADYLLAVKRADRPSSMITVNFASQERLLEMPGMLGFAKSRRLAYMANFTDLCPEMAPPGWHLYVATAVPRPAVGDFDNEAELALLWEDIREHIPDFDTRARVLSTVITRDAWPPQRAVAGFDLTPETPLPNLWNLGDGVKEYANGGTTACAETAKLVVERVLERLGS